MRGHLPRARRHSADRHQCQHPAACSILSLCPRCGSQSRHSTTSRRSTTSRITCTVVFCDDRLLQNQRTIAPHRLRELNLDLSNVCIYHFKPSAAAPAHKANHLTHLCGHGLLHMVDGQQRYPFHRPDIWTPSFVRPRSPANHWTGLKTASTRSSRHPTTSWHREHREPSTTRAIPNRRAA